MTVSQADLLLDLAAACNAANKGDTRSVLLLARVRGAYKLAVRAGVEHGVLMQVLHKCLYPDLVHYLITGERP